MKILQMTAENIKKLSVVDITPQGNLVQITGKNGQGKSSVLDAIWYALGGADSHPTKPIREGADSASITLDMGQYIVTRRFTEKGTTLSVKSKDGATFSGPQAMLDKMLGDLTFDPLEFSRMKPKDQYERMRVISGVGDKLEQLEGQERTAFEERTEANRVVKSLSSQVAAVVVPEGTPDAPVDVAALMQEGEEKSKENAAIDAAAQEVAKRNAVVEENKAEVERLEARIAELRSRNVAEYEAIQPLLTVRDTPKHDLEPLREKLRNAQSINAAVGEKQRKARLDAELQAAEAKAKELDAKVEDCRKQRQSLMENAKMPVDNLTLSEGQIFLKGIPFTQASTAEQLKVSVAIAMAANPQIRVIRIKDGSLLDDDSMSLIRSMADEHDYQVWIERVDGSGEVGIVMEDGHVKADNQEAATPTTMPPAGQEFKTSSTEHPAPVREPMAIDGDHLPGSGFAHKDDAGAFTLDQQVEA